MEVADAIETGVLRVFPDAEIVKIPVTDGGEGTVQTLINGLGGNYVPVLARDPLERPVKAFYGVFANKAILDMASASGLILITENERNPLIASTYGTGEIILSALEAGYTDIIIGIGGSATNDGGTGMARALGYRFLDAEGRELPLGGSALKHLVKIDDTDLSSLLRTANFHVACDVNNPLLGQQGASKVYAPQKGASEAMCNELEKGLTKLADVTEEWKGRAMREIPGAGAAGGLGFGLMAFCDAKLHSGIETVLNLLDFDAQLAGADFVITGEGRIDGQSIYGKVPIGVASRAQRKSIPVLAIVGSIGESASLVYSHGIDSVMTILDKPMLQETAMSRTTETLIDATERACRMIRMGLNISKHSHFTA